MLPPDVTSIKKSVDFEIHICTLNSVNICAFNYLLLFMFVDEYVNHESEIRVKSFIRLILLKPA